METETAVMEDTRLSPDEALAILRYCGIETEEFRLVGLTQDENTGPSVCFRKGRELVFVRSDGTMRQGNEKNWR